MKRFKSLLKSEKIILIFLVIGLYILIGIGILFLTTYLEDRRKAKWESMEIETDENQELFISTRNWRDNLIQEEQDCLMQGECCVFLKDNQPRLCGFEEFKKKDE